MMATSKSKSLTTRREFLWRFGGGLGGIALAHLLGEQQLLGGLHALTGSVMPGLLNTPHHPPRGQTRHSTFHEWRREPDGFV